jgi:hypothetical protein
VLARGHNSWQQSLEGASELKRAWFAELLKDVQPTEQALIWLLACLEKSEPKEHHAADYHLTNVVTEFVGTAGLELLPQLILGLNKLLSRPPVIEHRFYEVSKKFEWLLAPACKAIERLISARHPASIELNTLTILHKFSAARYYGGDGLADVKSEFSVLVPPWKELNQALFWFEVQRSRETLDKKRGERLTDWWQVSISGSFWQFEEDDFEYVAEEISRRTFLDDRLVGLSLAFNLYEAAERPRVWREQLKKLVAGNDELYERLGTFLRPPAQSQEQRDWKKQHVGAVDRV